MQPVQHLLFPLFGTLVDYVEQHDFMHTLTYPLWNGPCRVGNVDDHGRCQIYQDDMPLTGWFNASQLRNSQMIENNSGKDPQGDVPPMKKTVAR
jgi:hypothetical protein